MNIGATALEGLLILIVLLHGAARVWPKAAGYHYLRYRLSRRGVAISQIPPECIRAFVDDAHEYARVVCTPASRARDAVGRVPHFEFERILCVHSFVIHAYLIGRIAADTGSVVTAPEDLIATPLHADSTSTSRSVAHEGLMRELIRSEILRAGLEPTGDVAHCHRLEREVRAGSSWARYRAILGRYDLPRSNAPAAVGEPSH